jgi:hypothetical protein
MTVHLGFYNTSTSRTSVRFQFTTHEAAGGNVAPSSGFEAADIRIYRAADSSATSATQRSSANGITMTSPFDSLVGVHDVVIDLTDNSDSGFYAAGYQYTVILAPDETVDGQTITGIVLAYFEIGVPAVNTTLIEGSDATNQIRDAVVDDATRIDASALNTASTRVATALPNAAPAGNGGLPTVNASNYIAGIAGTLNTLDALDTAQDSQHSATQSALTTIDGIVDDILVDTGTTLPGTLTTIAGYIDTEVSAILADTNELQTDWANGGRLDLLIDGIKAVTDALPDGGALTTIDGNIDSILEDTGTTLPGTLTTIDSVVDDIKAVTDLLPDSGALSSLATASALSTVDEVVDAIKAVTDLLPDAGALSSLATASALSTVDGNVDAIKAQTDQITFTDGNVDANIEMVIGDQVQENGADDTNWGGTPA